MAIDPNINRIKFLRTSTSGKIPSTTDIQEGEIALNLADRTIYTRYGSNIVDIGFGKGGVVSGNITAPSFIGKLTGNADTATKLQTPRTINGTNFDGSANITTANWGTSRTISIGNSSKAVNGSANISWSLSDIGAVALNGSYVDSFTPSVDYYSPTSTTLASTDDLPIGRSLVSLTNSSIANLPTCDGDTFAYIETKSTFNSDGSKRHQVAYGYNNGYMEIRSIGSVNGTWGKWNKVAFTTSDISGNADTATKLQTPRTINGVSFDGSANITIQDSTKLPLAGGTITGALTVNGTLTANSITGNISGTARAVKWDNDPNPMPTGSDRRTIYSAGMNLRGIYGGDGLGYPAQYGNLFSTIGRSNLATTEIFHEWTSGRNNLYIRAIGDRPEHTWTPFKQVACVTDNVASATKLQTPRSINGIAFDGTKDIEIRAGNSAYIGSVQWFNGDYMRLPDGYQLGNGQLYKRSEYPEMWEAISKGQFTSVTDSEWLSNPSKRANYSTGDGSTTFRLPDLNGAQSDSLNAPFLRGKGTFAIGTVLSDAIRNITATAIGFRLGLGWTPTSTGAFSVTKEANSNDSNNGTAPTMGLQFDASKVVPTAEENRPISAVGYWIIKVAPDTKQSPSANNATLMHNEFTGNQIIHGDMIVDGNVILTNKSGIAVNLPLGFIEWFNGDRTKVRIGTLPADGQLLKRSDYPDLWAEVARGSFASVSDSAWLDNSIEDNRGCYSTGDGSTTFRLPDLNGMQSKSKKGLFLRGSGDKKLGIVEGDAIRNITGVGNGGQTITDYSGAITRGALIGSIGGTSTSTHRFIFDASNVVPTAEENRPVSAVGLWLIRVNGGVPNNNTLAPVATLDSNQFNGGQTFKSDIDVNGTATIKDLIVTGSSNISGGNRIWYRENENRVLNNHYENTYNGPIEVAVIVYNGAKSTGNANIWLSDNIDFDESIGTVISHSSVTIPVQGNGTVVAEVPKGWYYLVGAGTSMIAQSWSELR